MGWPIRPVKIWTLKAATTIIYPAFLQCDQTLHQMKKKLKINYLNSRGVEVNKGSYRDVYFEFEILLDDVPFHIFFNFDLVSL